MAAPQFVRRSYAGGVPQGTQLVAQIGSTDTTFAIANTTGWTEIDGSPLGTVGPFTVAIDLYTSSVEKILCSSVNLTTGLVTVYTSTGYTGRGYDNTTAQTHVPGSTSGVQPCWSATEADEANQAVVYGPGGGGAVIGLTGNPTCRLHQFAGESVATGLDIQIGNLTIDWEVGGMTTGTNSIIVPTTAKYQVNVSTGLVSSAAANFTLACLLYQNGSQVRLWNTYGTDIGGFTVGGSDLVSATAGDIFTWYIFQDSGSTLTTSGNGSQVYLSMFLASK